MYPTTPSHSDCVSYYSPSLFTGQVILGILTVIDILLILGIVVMAPVLRDKSPEDENYEGYSTLGYLWIASLDILLIPFNILCNFLTIALSYRCCDSMIVLCCGCLRCCRVIPITTEDHDAIFLEQIMRNSETKPGQHIEHEAPATRIQPAVAAGPVAAGAPAAAPAAIAMAPMPHTANLPPLTGAGAMDFDIVYEY